MLKFVYIFFIIIVSLQACQKQGELMTGKITGRIYVYDQSYHKVPDQSGVLVNLLQDDLIVATDTTESTGGYLFEKIPYGKYRIDLRKDKYIQGWNPPFIYHVGGYSPTNINVLGIWEIPTYELSLDSIDYSDYGESVIYLKFDGDTVAPFNLYGYQFIAYAGNSSDISKDNYITKANGILRGGSPAGYPEVTVPVFGKLLYSFSPALKDVISGPVYLRVYPLANGQGFDTSTNFYPEALGKPSNVISFIWNDQVRK